MCKDQGRLSHNSNNSCINVQEEITKMVLQVEPDSVRISDRCLGPTCGDGETGQEFQRQMDLDPGGWAIEGGWYPECKSWCLG